MELSESLAALCGTTVEVSDPGGFPEQYLATTKLRFSNGSWLVFLCWRAFVGDKCGPSSFDHRQKYGLPAPIDAISDLSKLLSGKKVARAVHDTRTGDLLIWFNGEIELQVLNVTGFEIWEIHFPDGTVEYSNQAKKWTGSQSASSGKA